MIPGTVQDLRGLRSLLLLMRDTANSLSVLGEDAMATRMCQQTTELARTVMSIPTPCLICTREFPVHVQVGDEKNSEPSAVICGPCDTHPAIGRLRAGKSSG